jgi:hypothetical protein
MPRTNLSTVDILQKSFFLSGPHGPIVLTDQSGGKFGAPLRDESMVDRRGLRELAKAPGILVMPEIFDGFSVRLVERRSESLPGPAVRGVLTFADNLRAYRALADHAGVPPLVPDPLLPFGELNALMCANRFDSIHHTSTTP